MIIPWDIRKLRVDNKGWEQTFLIRSFGLSKNWQFVFICLLWKFPKILFPGCLSTCLSDPFKWLIQFRFIKSELVLVLAFLTKVGLFKIYDSEPEKSWTLLLQMLLVFILKLLSTHYTMQTQSMWFSLWKIHIPHWNVKCVENIQRPNLKLWHIIQTSI